MPEDYFITVNWEAGKHDFRLRGGPIDDPQGTQSLFQLLGVAAAAWGRLETHINAILIQINQPDHSTPTRRLHEPKFPRSFFDKTELLKLYFTRHPALIPHSSSMLTLVKDLEIFSKYRNELSHGIVEIFHSDRQSFILNSIEVKQKTGVATIARTERPLVGLQDFISGVNSANEWLITLASRLFTEEFREELRKS